MIRTSPKGYMAPWSSRRETVGLMGTFVLFLVGFPGHAELVLSHTRQLFQQMISLMLVFLGLVTPVVNSSKNQIHQAVARVHQNASGTVPHLSPLIKPALQHEMTSVPMNLLHRRVAYIFEGKATLHDQPCPNASVLIRLSSGERSVTQGTITGKDGSYRVQAS